MTAVMLRTTLPQGRLPLAPRFFFFTVCVTMGSMSLIERKQSSSPPDLRKAVREAVGKYIDLGVCELFVFGSEARGAASPGSDIDIGIRAPQPLAKHTIQRIRDELEKIRTLRVFDVVDLAAADPSFREQALQNAEKL